MAAERVGESVAQRIEREIARLGEGKLSPKVVNYITKTVTAETKAAAAQIKKACSKRVRRLKRAKRARAKKAHAKARARTPKAIAAFKPSTVLALRGNKKKHGWCADEGINVGG